MDTVALGWCHYLFVFNLIHLLTRGFLGDSMVKKIHLQCKRHKICRFNPWVGEIPWSRKWLPSLVFLPGKFHVQRSLVGYNPWGGKE